MMSPKLYNLQVGPESLHIQHSCISTFHLSIVELNYLFEEQSWYKTYP
jgi:hypothetical protein